MTECNIEDHLCAHHWKFFGSLEGECLTYSAGGREFLRDAELRITIFGNDSGNGLRLLLAYRPFYFKNIFKNFSVKIYKNR